MPNPFRCFNSLPEVIRLTVMMYIRYLLSPRQVEDILIERGIDICHGQCVSGGIGSVQCLPGRSGNGALSIIHIRTGVGVWTRFSCGSTARRIISGVPLITRGKV
jgi:hypothetical protein